MNKASRVPNLIFVFIENRVALSVSHWRNPPSRRKLAQPALFFIGNESSWPQASRPIFENIKLPFNSIVDCIGYGFMYHLCNLWSKLCNSQHDRSSEAHTVLSLASCLAANFHLTTTPIHLPNPTTSSCLSTQVRIFALLQIIISMPFQVREIFCF